MKPNAAEIKACRWWLSEELRLVAPKLVIALGATAARSLLGRATTISAMRGPPAPFADNTHLMVTVHPSALLRIPDEASGRSEYGRFVKDLRMAHEWLRKTAGHPADNS